MDTLMIIIYLAVGILGIAGLWMTFQKAGEAGWQAIIPIWNTWIILKICGRPGWWLILLLIPIVNIVVLFIVMIDVARSFGKGTGFGIGLALLSVIFFAILGFGSAQYQGPAAASA